MHMRTRGSAHHTQDRLAKPASVSQQLASHYPLLTEAFSGPTVHCTAVTAEPGIRAKLAETMA